MVEMNLIEVRTDEFFAQFMRLTTEERHLQPDECRHQELHRSVGINICVSIGRFHLAQRARDTNSRCGYAVISLRRLTKAIRSAVHEWTKSERSFRSTTQISSNPATE